MVHLIFAIVIINLLPINKLIKTNKNKLIISLLILFVFLAFRYNYGNDYKFYLEIYNNIKEGIYTRAGNDFVFKMWNIISVNYAFLLGSSSLLYVFTIYCLIKKYAKESKFFISLLLLLVNPYLFLIHLTTIRQTMALCFLILFIIFYKNKYCKLIFTILGIGCHFSSILIFPFVVILKNFRLTKKSVYIIYVILFILMSTNLLETLILVFGRFINNNFLFYLETNKVGSLRTLLLNIIINLFIVKYYKEVDEDYRVVYNMTFVGSLLSILSIKFAMLFRIQMYFEIFIIVIVPYLFEKENESKKKYFFYFMVFTIYSTRYISFFLSPMYAPHYVNYDLHNIIDFFNYIIMIFN